MTVVKIQDRLTGEFKTAVYAPNSKGNMVYHVDGKPVSDRAFDKKYKIVTDTMQPLTKLQIEELLPLIEIRRDTIEEDPDSGEFNPLEIESMNPIKINISKSVRAEWMMKEESSYEDHGRPDTGHVFCVLCDNWKNGKLTINTEEELKLLQTSASYQTSWDEGEHAVVDRLIAKAAEICKIKF